MIIWRGLGFLVAVFTFASSLVAQLITEKYLGKGTYWDVYKWPFGLALLVAATASWILGDFQANKKIRRMVDKDTGEEFVLRNKNTLFFIDMKWWGLILGGIGLVIIIVDLWKNKI